MRELVGVVCGQAGWGWRVLLLGGFARAINCLGHKKEEHGRNVVRSFSSLQGPHEVLLDGVGSVE